MGYKKDQIVRSKTTDREYTVAKDQRGGRVALVSDGGFTLWKDAIDLELVVAEAEEAFEPGVEKLDVEAGEEPEGEVEFDIRDEPFDGKVDISIHGRTFRGHFERVDFGEFGGNVEMTFSGKEKPRYVTGVDYADLESAVAVHGSIQTSDLQHDPAWRMRYDNSSKRRKEQPVMEGVLKYCPAAIRLMAEVSRLGNEKHNPGQPLHHARDKSTDHLDCAVRHLMDADKLDEESGLIEALHAMWRTGMYIQEKCERDFGWPKAPNARGEAPK